MPWIFGYGSLIWRPGFPYNRCRKAAVRGWRRRFWQASPDHRGVPDAPGRVVTLVEDGAAVCWGLAFEPPEEHWARIIDALDEREKNGYCARDIELEFEDGTRGAALTYIAGPDNPSFVGPAPLALMAAQIARARGPSGSNREYLSRLARMLEDWNVHDDEVAALSAAMNKHD